MQNQLQRNLDNRAILFSTKSVFDQKFEIFTSQPSSMNSGHDQAERTQMCHDAASVGFFHTIFGVTWLLHFFLPFHY